MNTIETAAQATALLHELAADRGRNVLLVGPPGSGKTMFARRLGWLLPQLEPGSVEQRDLAFLFYGAGLLTADEAADLRDRPLRAPHHTCSVAALTGSGFAERPRPGEASLAHGGVLFLDEVTEFRTAALDGVLKAVRAGARYLGGTHYPARPWCVLGSASPCPCGYLWGLGANNPRPRRCKCRPEEVAGHQARLLAEAGRGLFHEIVRFALDYEQATILGNSVQPRGAA